MNKRYIYSSELGKADELIEIIEAETDAKADAIAFEKYGLDYLSLKFPIDSEELNSVVSE